VLVNIHHDSPGEHRRLLLFGTIFLISIGLLGALSIAVYQKVFEPVTMVTIKADRAGLQLAKFGDVRIHGVLVGQVRSISQDGKEASIEVGLRPEAARRIPSNIEVEILPTTLFGQKFISFVTPENPSDDALSDGDVISSDRVTTNVELSRILADLFPLIRAIKPADLNATLNALATALQGRGEDLGETMDKLGSYLGAIDEHLPTLRKDLILLADVADTYDIAAPDLLKTLENVSVTSRTVIARSEQLETFFSDLAGLAKTSTRVLSRNETNLIRVGEVTAPILNLLAVYSPEFPCLLKGLDRYTDYLNDMFEGQRVKQFVELNATQREGYKPEDRPQYGEVGHGPWCLGLPYPPVPIAPMKLKNGDNYSVDKNNPLNLFTAGIADTSMGYFGTEADQKVVSALLAAESGNSVESYGAMSSLMYGPLIRGKEVAG
jgi:phospholipid/cholesterol/gamma-HCH transport system substrate-binding protein